MQVSNFVSLQNCVHYVIGPGKMGLVNRQCFMADVHDNNCHLRHSVQFRYPGTNKANRKSTGWVLWFIMAILGAEEYLYKPRQWISWNTTIFIHINRYYDDESSRSFGGEAKEMSWSMSRHGCNNFFSLTVTYLFRQGSARSTWEGAYRGASGAKSKG